MAEQTREKSALETAADLALELDQYRQLVESASDAVVTINQKHEVVFMNRAAEEMFGYKRGKILGGSLTPLIPKRLLDDHRNFVERYVRTRLPRVMGRVIEVQGQRRNGDEFPMSISFSQTQTSGGLLLTAMMRDLSHEKKMADRVKQTEQLAAVGQTVATVSHEIRTPLALIGGFAVQLERETGLSVKAKRKLGIIVDEVARLEAMLKELNDLSRPLNYRWEELDPAGLMKRARSLMSPKLRQGRMTVNLDLGPDLPLAAVDPNRISQVLINLINNAIQASAPGDELTLSAKTGPGGEIILEVRDMGSGIRPDRMDKLFDPFYTTKQRGTGLGLPVARRIVQDHGGDIEVDSKPGQGTTMRISLPPAHGQ